jgi:PncC family amidohydrolase
MLAEDFPDAARLGSQLGDLGLTIAVAESCTGGLLGAALTSIAGSSVYVRGGVIAYADDVKADHLGVSRLLLSNKGAVSAEVAEAMAVGVRDRYGASIGVGITGVAGPASSERKPAGVVFVAVATQGTVRGLRLDEDLGREGNRAAAVRAALTLSLDVVAAMTDGERQTAHTAQDHQ